MGVFRTVNYIVGNPRRSRGWKVFDVTLLCLIWSAAMFSVVSQLGDPVSSWSVVAKILVPIAVLAGARSWYH